MERARIAQWVRQLGYLTTHTSLSPIQRGFAPGFVNYKKKGCTRLAATSDNVYQLLAHGRWFSPGTPASSTTKTGRHDIAEILLKVALNTKNKIKSKYSWRGELDTTLCDKVCQWSVADRGFLRVLRFSPPTDRHNLSQILLKVALNTINQQTKIMHNLEEDQELLAVRLLMFCFYL